MGIRFSRRLVSVIREAAPSRCLCATRRPLRDTVAGGRLDPKRCHGRSRPDRGPFRFGAPSSASSDQGIAVASLLASPRRQALAGIPPSRRAKDRGEVRPELTWPALNESRGRLGSRCSFHASEHAAPDQPARAPARHQGAVGIPATSPLPVLGRRAHRGTGGAKPRSHAHGAGRPLASFRPRAEIVAPAAGSTCSSVEAAAAPAWPLRRGGCRLPASLLLRLMQSEQQ